MTKAPPDELDEQIWCRDDTCDREDLHPAHDFSHRRGPKVCPACLAILPRRMYACEACGWNMPEGTWEPPPPPPEPPPPPPVCEKCQGRGVLLVTSPRGDRLDPCPRCAAGERRSKAMIGMGRAKKRNSGYHHKMFSKAFDAELRWNRKKRVEEKKAKKRK